MKWILFFSLLTYSVIGLTQDKDPVVATVNGKNIYKSTLEKYHEQNLRFVRANKVVTIESSLNDLIDRIIGIDEAKKAKVDKQPEVKKKMNDIMYHAYISKEIAPLLKGLNKKITDKGIKKYYNSNPEYRTSQILLRLRANPSEDEVKKMYETAATIRSELQKTEKNKEKSAKVFEDWAKKYSQTSTAHAGGDLGYQPSTRLSPKYYEMIKGKKIGTITPVFRTQYGFHIVRVSGVKEYKQIDKNLYRKILYDIERDKILQNYFKKKRNKAKLKIVTKNLK